MKMTTPHRQGFTLLELLVVIAILGALIGLTTPSLYKARIQARDSQCKQRLRGLYVSHTAYLHDYDRFPALNNQEDDGTWQYNYLIYDGREFESNFGPLYDDGNSLDTIKQLYCPRQTDPYHSLGTPENNWPPVKLLDTRAGYSRRYHLSGKSLSQFRGTPAILADLIHLPKVIKSGHKNGVNVAYLDGHVQFVKDTDEILTDNDLTHPFKIVDNGIIEDIWDVLNRAGK